jgi:hypothetical protein
MKKWSEIDGWFSDDDARVYELMVKHTPDDGHILEIGAYKGRSTVCLAQEIIKQKKNIKIHVVDTFFGDGGCYEQDTYDEFMSNMLPYALMVGSIRRGYSMNIAETNKFRYDGIYIDGAHDYLSVSTDIRSWLPFLSLEGIIAGHDYNFDSVRKATDEYFSEITCIGNSWVVFP